MICSSAKRTDRLFGVSAIIMAMIMILALFSACTGGSPEITENETTVPAETLPPAPEVKYKSIVSEGKTEYGFIRPLNADVTVLRECNYLDGVIKDCIVLDEGVSLEITNDYIWNEDSIGEYEVLIGNTNREESSKAVEGLAEGDWTVRFIGKKLVINGNGNAATAEAVTWFTDTFVRGFSEIHIPEDIMYVRSSAPKIIAMSQEDCYYNLGTNSPEINFSVGSPDGSNPDIVRFVIDGRDASRVLTGNNEEYTLSGIAFESGMHTVSLTIKDKSGKTGYESFLFGCGDCDDMHLYIGELHSHTSDSDGIGTPTEAYEYAKNTAKMDFYAVTDHSNSHSEQVYFEGHVAVADAMNQPGRFVALSGYEQTYGMSTGYSGHLNSINSSVFTKNSMFLYDYYKKMAETEGALVQFNHPGYSWGNFNEYEGRTDEYDNVVNLYEFKGSSYDNEWALCLAKGWHVSPMHNEDNHTGQWGTVNEAVGVVLSPSLTRQNIVEAMAMNRSYTTTDQSLKIYFSINGTWMGGRLDAPSSLDVTVHLSTEKRTGLGNIYIVGEDNIVVASVNAGTKREYDWNITLSPEHDYYYVKVNGTSGFAVTAPVWVENRDKLCITDLSQSLITYNNGSEKDHVVTAGITNTSDKTMTDVEVKFYNSPLSGFAIQSAKPIETVKIGTLAPGASASAQAAAAYSLSSPRVTAVVTGKCGGEQYGDTVYCMLNRLLITEVATSGSGYSYVEIYNNTASPLPLSSFSIRYWPKQGAKADALAAVTMPLSGTIPANGTMVIWLRNKTNISVSQFNQHYGCSLTEGKNLLVLNSSWATLMSGGVQIEVLDGTTVVTRAQYNYDIKKIDSIESRSVEYRYADMYSQTVVKTASRKTPSPGKLIDGSVPAVIASR
ncbi:MAG: CehA/McbA family metallohydrolase [Clostridia bacterium]|nr:CehA/McbA family metallohydrolase [Clostridia bacterium]